MQVAKSVEFRDRIVIGKKHEYFNAYTSGNVLANREQSWAGSLSAPRKLRKILVIQPDLARLLATHCTHRGQLQQRLKIFSLI